jgi:hypothetical protein
MSSSVNAKAVTLEQAPDLLEQWRHVEAASDNSFFLGSCWIGAWLRVTRPRGYFFTATCSGTSCGAAIVVKAPRNWYKPWQTVFRLHDTGVQVTDGLYIEYNGIACHQTHATETLSAFVHELQGIARQSRRLLPWPAHLEISAASPGFTALMLSGFPETEVVRKEASPFVALESLRRSGTSYLDGLSANARQQLRRARRSFEKLGPLRLEPATSVSEAEQYLAALKPLHVARWRARSKPSGFDNPAFEPMLRELIRSGVPSRSVEVLRVVAGPRPLGYLVNFISQGQHLNYTSGFDYDAFPGLKPGLVSHLLAIEDADARGATHYKFLAGATRYKTSLSTDSEELAWLRLRL